MSSPFLARVARESDSACSRKKSPLQYSYCKGRYSHAVPPLLQFSPLMQRFLPPSFARNGSCRAVLKPLRDGLHMHSCQPLSALTEIISSDQAVFSGAFLHLTVLLNVFTYCLELMISYHSTFFPECKALFYLLLILICRLFLP